MASKMRLASARSDSRACSPPAIAVAAASTSAGVFGIARMTRVPLASRAWIVATGTPAAIEITSASREIVSATSSSTRLMICGLTDNTTISADAGL